MNLKSNTTPLRRLLLACGATTIMAAATIGMPSAHAASPDTKLKPVVTDPAVPPGDVSTTTETAGWVSDDWLKKHPNSKVGKMLAKDEVAVASAFKCSPPSFDTCINIQGNDLYVDLWSTQARGNVGCVRAEYYVNRRFVTNSYLICPTARDGLYYSSRNIKGSYPNGTLLQNDWGDRLGATPTVDLYVS